MTRRSTQNGIAVHPDLNDLRDIRRRVGWYEYDKLLPLHIVGGYGDLYAIGKCGRPLWRCDLTCPEPELIGPLPYMDPSDPPF
ncbi:MULTISPECIES: hypothetical protein [Desulfovibrionaceae]|uniref:hypothetical protein n=1 Tax=Desulfovibrionaceae TaxID=194924 RepID=UPI001A930310|nr:MULTISPECIES: hypothetical protein [Desulfovibrionaceae]WFS63815.1 hypothetical protein LF599_06535 [Pseudodesulfovibrio thermohalotolerans]